MFDCVDIEWEENYEEPSSPTLNAPLNAPAAANDSLNSSRISLNLNAMKEAILGKSVDDKFRTIRNIFSKSSGSPSTAAKKPDMLKSALTNTEVQRKRLLYEDEGVLHNRAAKTPHQSPGLRAAAAQSRQRRFEVTAQACVKEIRKNTTKLKTLFEELKNDENVQTANSDRLFAIMEQMEQLTVDLRNALNSTDPPPASRTPKSVRFLLD